MSSANGRGGPPLPDDLDDPTGPLDGDPEAATGPLNAARAPARPPALSAGEVLAGRFRILRLVGRGGMGEVYEAEDLELRDRIALKVVPPDLARDARSLERFRHEIYLARKVTHPNVCRLFDVFHHRRGGQGDLVFVTMELLEGETLRDHVHRHGSLDVDAVGPLVAQVAAALAAAHAAGVVHQDLKSANVMLVPGSEGETRAVVTDFGLARGHGRGESAAGGDRFDLVGTPAYMAPEQLLGDAITPATDVFALGVVLYEALTGRLPFGPDVPTDRLNERPPAPDRWRPGLPATWNDAISRCLDPDPGERFPGVLELAEALGLEMGAASPRLKQELARARRRQKALALVAGALAVGLGAWLVTGGPPTPPVTQAGAQQLTTSAGLDAFPAVSPDGATLAYSANTGEGFEIRLLALEGGGSPRTLASDDVDAVEAAWSPSGDTIAFHSLSRGGIWLAPVAGGEPRRLTDFGSHPVWSPDGRRLAFQSDALSPLSANALPARPPSSLWTVSVTGGPPTQITAPGEPPGGHGTPSWSPDGEHVVFAAYERSRSAVWRVAAGGGVPQPVLDDGNLIYDPVLSSDGELMLYVARSPEGDVGLFGVAVDGRGRTRGEPVAIAPVGLGTPRHLSLSESGDALFFSVLGLESNLQWLALDPSGRPAGAPVALTNETARHSRPAFSPDGSQVAFEKWSAGERPDVWLIDVDTRESRPLTRAPAMDAEPAFTDGGEVAFLSDRGGALAVWSADAGSGEARRLCPLPPEAEFVRVAPDGSTVAFNSNRGRGTTNLWTMPVCGAARALTDDAELLGFAAWSPTGTELAAQQRRGATSRVVVVSHPEGEVSVLTEGEQDWAYGFSPDAERVSFVRLRDGTWNLWWVDRQGNELQLTERKSPHGYVRYPAWSPRGDGLVYELAESRGNIWRLDLRPAS